MTSDLANKKESKIFIVIALILIFIMAARMPVDTDLWWHLRAGEETIRSGAPMIVDTFSFSRLNQSWTNHSWLSQVLLFETFQNAGYIGLCIFMAIFAVLSMWLVSLQMRGNPITKMFLIIFGGIVASVNWVPRPQILSLVFLALTGYILQRYQQKPAKWIWCLPLIFILWGNLHGGYALGLILCGCFLLSEILRQLLGQSSAMNWREIIRFSTVIVISFLATAINPNGLKTLLIPFQTVGVEGLQNSISEWASPDFHEPLQLVFLFYFLILIWLLVLSKKPTKLEYLISISVFAILAFTARRNIGPFVIVTLPIMADQCANFEIPSRIIKWIDAHKKKQKPLVVGLQKVINVLIIAFLSFAAVVKVLYASQTDLVNQYLREEYPIGAMEWVSANLSPARMMNEYNWGGFIAWRLRDYPIFIDGRTDLFGDEIFTEWNNVMQCSSETQQILEKWDVHLLLVNATRPIVQCALNDGWHLVYQDDQAAVLTDGQIIVR